MEFEVKIVVLAWDQSEECLVVGDSSGTLHLVTSGGTLLFSKKLPLSDNVMFVSLQFIPHKETDNLQTLLATISDGTILGISNMPVGTIVSFAASEPKALGPVLQSLQFNKCALPLTEGVFLSKSHVFVGRSSDAEDSDICRVLSVTSVGVVIVADLGQLGSLASPESFLMASENTVPTKNCVDFHVQTVSSQCNVVHLLYGDGLLVVADSGLQTALATMRLDIASPLMALVQQPATKGVTSTTGEYFHSVILVTERGGADQRPVCKTQLLGMTVAVVSTERATVSLLDLGVRALRTAEGDTKPGLRLVASRGHDCECALMVDSGESTLSLVRLTEPVASLMQELSRDYDLHDCTAASLIGRIARAILSDTEESPAGLHSEFLARLVALSASEGATCGEVTAVAHLLIHLPNPPPGFIDKLLATAEAAVESNKTARHTDPGKQRCIAQLLKLAHLRETASAILATGDEDEEHLRLTILSLLPQSLSVTIVDLLRGGAVQHAILSVQRHLSGSALPVCAVEALDSVPLSASVTDISTLVRGVFLPVLDRTSVSRNDELLALVESICSRARAVEATGSRPLDALMLVQLAMDITASLPQIESAATKLTTLKTLHSDLRLQQVIWRQWGEAVSLSDVSALGLEALLFDRLDSVSEETLSEEVRSSMLAVATAMGQDLDGILHRWIEHTVARRIIRSGVAGVDEDDDDDVDEEEQHFRDNTREATQQYAAGETCTVSRLVAVLSLIGDRNIVAKLALVLFQIPSVENSSLKLSLAAAAGAAESADVTQQLCKIATSVCDYVDSATREALVAAMRLLKVKALAASYGIRKFDPRDSRQVRAAVCIISSSFHRGVDGSCVGDAISFAADWGFSNVELNALVVRALTLRICSDGSETVSGCEEAVKRILSVAVESAVHGGSLQVVAEEAVSFCLDALQEACEGITFNPSFPSSDKSSELEKTATQVLRGALWVCSFFLDSLRKKNVIAAATAAQPSATTCDREASSLLLSSSRKPKASEDCGTSFLTAALHLSLKRLQSLQTGHGLYLSLASLRNDRVCKAVVLKMAKARVAEVTKTGSNAAVDMLPLNAHCRRLCVLLGVSPVYFSHTSMKLLVETNNMPLAMEVARSLSSEKAQTAGEQNAVHVDGAESALFDSAQDSALLLDAALTLCGIAAKKASQSNYDEFSGYPMMSLGPNQDNHVPEHLSFPVRAFELSRDVLRASVSHCQPAYIGRTLDLLCGSELVLSVYERVEGATKLSATAVSGATVDGPPQLLQLSDGGFSRDGILMQPSAVVKPLMRYALAEVRRRSVHATAIAGGKAVDLKKSDGGSQDLEELVGVLQRSENHLLATRTLFSSWVAGGAKSQLLKSSLTALSRKILVYRDIDKPFAVACLAALPYEAMVRELKTSVPSIQSDFSRLRTVALVGEELSQLWDNADLLNVFQVMQTNARWWHVLSSLGIKLDMRTFQSMDTDRRDVMIRSLVPELLTRSGMDLELALEYCQQYHLEPACALLAYIEMLLKTPPQSTADVSWAGKVRRAAGRVEDKLVLGCLRNSLLGVSPVDYERIRYVCAWLMDMLSLEESAGGRGADDEDDSGDGLNRSVALDNTAQRVKLANLTNVAEEIDTYRKYSDIAAYLAGIHFPADAVAQIAGASETYRGVSGIYRERVPLWQLLDGPWTVIEPLLSAVPEVAMKLSPLCTALQLDKNDFSARRIKALYANMTSSVKCAANDNSDALLGPSPFSRETKRLSLQVAAESIAATVSDPLQQVAVYRWLYDRERGSDDVIAKLALDSALSITTPLVNRNPTYSVVHADLRSDLLTLSCECIVRQFIQQCLVELPAVAQTLLSRLSDPPALLKLLLELSLEVAWDLQMRSLAIVTVDGVVVLPSCYDVTLRAPAHSASSFLTLVAAAVDDLAAQCGLDQPVIVANGPASAQQKPSVLESIRFDIVGRMLNDIDGNGVSDKDPSASAAAVSMSKGFWGVGGHSASVLTASEAETRRREDVYLSFAIAAAISTCTDATVKRMYIAQQDALMRGKSSSTQRRLTCRSRFRAAQALSFLRLASAGRERENQITVVYDAPDLDPFRRYLYCLAEMKEIRLSCTEESLLAAMGLTIRDFVLYPATEESGAVVKADPRSLIRTWLHDEGAHVEVVELARDLQLVANASDEASWYLLLTHMLSKDQHRALLQTVTALQHIPIFRDLCFGLVGADVLQCTAKVLAEAVEKAEQVLQLAGIRSSSPESGDWLHCALTSTSDSKERPSKGSVETTTGKDGKAATAATGKKHRVFLQPRLAYGTGTWDEHAPEDVLSTLFSATRLCGALASVLSSRLLSRHNSLATIRASAIRMLGLTQTYAAAEKAGQRDVCGGTLEALACSGLSLLSPAYLLKDGTLAATSSTYIVDAVNAVCGAAEGKQGASLLWKVFAASSQRFSTDAVFKTLDALIDSQQDAMPLLLSESVSTPCDEDAVKLLAWCFERLSVPTARTVISSSIKSQSAAVKLALVKRIRSLDARIQEIIGTTLPPLDTLMQ